MAGCSARCSDRGTVLLGLSQTPEIAWAPGMLGYRLEKGNKNSHVQCGTGVRGL